MQVIGAGFGRTGTLSLKAALERLLDGPCYHMEAVIRQPAHIERWHAAARDETVDWEALFQGFTAGVDWPIARFWRPLTEQFPDAKVVLTVRDPDAWYRSVHQTIFRFGEVLSQRPARWLVEATGTHAGFQPMVDAAIWGPSGAFGGRFLDRDHALSVYEAHIAEVKATLPAERLLVFDVREGWGPLCDFLDRPVPDEPFPRTNSTAVMKRRLAAVRTFSWLAAPVTAPVARIRRSR